MTIYATYIWTDSNNKIRNKLKIIPIDMAIYHTYDIKLLRNYPEWNYDGSSTGQATGNNSEVLIRPVKVYRDTVNSYMVFTEYSAHNQQVIVLCETYNVDGTPHSTNKRYAADKLMKEYADKKPLFGIEQEFFIFHKDIEHNVNLEYADKKPQGNYYCGVGGNNISSIERKCIEEIICCAMSAELSITGMNVEVAPSQWEIQVCAEGIQAADQIMLLRYIMSRIAEKYNLYINIEPKPLKGEWNGSGCHVNFSTLSMRKENGYINIQNAIDNLKEKHTYHISHYGIGNKERLSGKYETAGWENFTFGVADRGASIRIPSVTILNKCGYFEDRRPSSNMNPYVVCPLIFSTSCGLEYNVE
jgi:glutamine synthetase